MKILLIAAGLLSGVFGSLFFTGSSNKTGFVETTELYNNFKLKKELEQKYVVIENKRQEILDSLELRITKLTRQLNSSEEPSMEEVDKFKYLSNQFKQKQQQFAEDNGAMSQKFNEQIWSQINQYINDYGKEKGYDYIYGANGDGSLMYANKSVELTDEVTEYINQKYTGKK